MDEKDHLAGRRDELLRRLAGPGPVFVNLGDNLGRLEVWSEVRWDAMADHERPADAEHFEGLGWVIAIRVPDLN